MSLDAMSSRLARIHLAPLFAFTLIAACSSSDETGSTRAAVAQGCNINSDCTEPLVCAFRKCHTACETTRDCPAGQRCMASDRPFHVCQLPEESKCTYNSECPTGQVCGIDGQCRDQCSADRDCVAGQKCANGSCAEPTELRDGGLPISERVDPDAGGTSCVYDSDCSKPFVCRNGTCAAECLKDSDCGAGRVCNASQSCEWRICGGLDAGTEGGQACSFNSECTAPLVCRDGHCDCQCIDDRDCAAGQTCTGYRCTSAAGAGADGGAIDDPVPDASAD